MGRWLARDGAIGLGAAGVAWLVVEVARAGLAVCLISCGAACVVAVVAVEVPSVVRHKVEAVQAAMFAEVAGRLRKDGKGLCGFSEAVSRSDAVSYSVVPAGRGRTAADLRALAEEGRVLAVRLSDWGAQARLADGLARAVALWERRARWALRGHRVEWVAFGGAAGRERFAVTVAEARDKVAALVMLLLSVAGELDEGGGPSSGGGRVT